MKIFNLEKTIIDILKNNTETRANDHLLYTAVVEKINPNTLNMNFRDVFNYPSKHGLPAFVSVCRARRMVQKENTNLLPDKIIQDIREEKVNDYIGYSRGYNITI
ncbi:MAG: hypothetical protein RR489_06800 [Clostridia bacterium]